ncbi:hypothetical protein ACHAXT_009573 [Thalassiosira profunda]
MEAEKQVDAAADSAAAAVPALPPVEGAGAAAVPALPGFGHITTAPPGHTQKHPKKKVASHMIDHTYRDYSNVQVSEDEYEDEGDELTRGGGKQRHVNFPAKLHAIVSNPNYQHIICWQPHGRSWKIVDKHLLATVICPKHFAHSKFESFNRNVNGWGFKRLLNPGPDCKSYYHECFLRGRPQLTKLMQRLVNPGKRLPDKAGEPDFYEISEKFPLPELDGVKPGPPKLGVPQPSPAARQHGSQPPMWASPSPHANPYAMYGYPMPGLPPPAMSPASGNQHPYWQSPPGSSPPFQAPPYGYYPYPAPMMMAPQGGYYVPQPYAHPGGYPGQPYPPGPAAPGAAPPGPTEAPPASEEKKAEPETAAEPAKSENPEEAKSAEGDAEESKDEAKEDAKKEPVEPKAKKSSKRASKDSAEGEKASKKGKSSGKKDAERKNARRSPRTTSV